MSSKRKKTQQPNKSEKQQQSKKRGRSQRFLNNLTEEQRELFTQAFEAADIDSLGGLDAETLMGKAFFFQSSSN
jgi:hypothetical protein